MSSSSTDRAAFLVAICANPADDTARLVFADWLDEHGDPIRAAIIRAGVAHPEHTLAGERWALVSREEVWRFDGRKDIKPPGTTERLRAEVPNPAKMRGVSRLYYRRGFLEGVRVDFATWAARGDRTIEQKRFPLTRVEFVEPPVFESVSFVHGPDGAVCTADVGGYDITVPNDPSFLKTLLDICAARWRGLTFTATNWSGVVVTSSGSRG